MMQQSHLQGPQSSKTKHLKLNINMESKRNSNINMHEKKYYIEDKNIGASSQNEKNEKAVKFANLIEVEEVINLLLLFIA